MQLKNRYYVEGTEPGIYIGHRISRRANGVVSISKTYHAEYTIESRQRSKSLRTSNRGAAIRAAHALSEQVRQGIETKPLKKSSVADIKEAYLTVQTNRGRSPRTLGKYRHNLSEFADWWNKRDGRPAMKVTEADFWMYRQWLKDAGQSDQTIEDRLIVVKQLFKWAAGKGKMLAANPLADATVPEPPPTPQPCFTPQQVELLLRNAKPSERPIWALMAYTGLRVGEVVALRWQHVLFDRGEHGFINVQLGGSNGTTKGKRSRLVPIHPDLLPILLALPREHATVFVRAPNTRYPHGRRARMAALSVMMPPALRAPYGWAMAAKPVASVPRHSATRSSSVRIACVSVHWPSGTGPTMPTMAHISSPPCCCGRDVAAR